MEECTDGRMGTQPSSLLNGWEKMVKNFSYKMYHYILLIGLALFYLSGCGDGPLIKRGKELAANGDTDAAIKKFEEAINHDGSRAEAFYQIGLVYVEMVDKNPSGTAYRSDAKEALSWALDMAPQWAPRRAEIRLTLGTLCWRDNQKRRALLEFNQLLEKSPPRDILSKLAGLTGDAYHVQRLRTEGSDDYEQTFTEKGNMMTFTAKYTDDYSPAISPDGKTDRLCIKSAPERRVVSHGPHRWIASAAHTYR